MAEERRNDGRRYTTAGKVPSEPTGFRAAGSFAGAVHAATLWPTGVGGAQRRINSRRWIGKDKRDRHWGNALIDRTFAD